MILSGSQASAQNDPLRYLAINVGNASPQFGCWESKLCRAQDVANLRDYIAAWQPDIVLLSEVSRADQLTGVAENGPILPSGYDGRCGESRDRDTGALVAWDASNASHEHECVAWKTSRLSPVAGSARSAYGRNDNLGKSRCGYDFTGFRMRLVLDGQRTITAVSVHPDSGDAACRTEEIGRYWAELAQGERVLIGGDWNTEAGAELERPSRFVVNYSAGRHADGTEHTDEFSAIYLGIGGKHLDHAFANFGLPCTDCGAFLGSGDLAHASALGGYDGHPRADAGDGFDHRQILVDLTETSALSMSSDWPLPAHDAARTRYNPGENTLMPPFGAPWSSSALGLDVTAPIAVGDTAFAYCEEAPAELGQRHADYICAIDLATKTVVWQARLDTIIPQKQVFPSALTYEGGALYFTTNLQSDGQSGILYAVDAATGALSWTKSFGTRIEGANPLLSGTTLYLTDVSGRTYGVDTTTRKTLFSTLPPVERRGSETLLVNDTLVYLTGSGSTTWTALDRTTGALLWSEPVPPGSITYRDTLMGSPSHNLVYLLTDISTGIYVLRARDATTGAEAWSHQQACASRDTPLVAAEGRIYWYCEDSDPADKSLLVFDGATGTLVDYVALPPSDLSPTELIMANGVLYMSRRFSPQTNLRAVRAADGNHKTSGAEPP